MATVQTPEQGKPITDFIAGVFDGLSLLFQSRNGAAGKVSGDDVANYVVNSKVYSSVGNCSIVEAIGKPIDGELTAGQTTVTFSDASIKTTSIIDVYVDDAFLGVVPKAISASTGSVTLTFDVQSANMPVLIIVRGG